MTWIDLSIVNVELLTQITDLTQSVVASYTVSGQSDHRRLDWSTGAGRDRGRSHLWFDGGPVQLAAVDDTGREERGELVEDGRVLLLARVADHGAHLQREGRQLLARGQTVQLQHVLRIDTRTQSDLRWRRS